MHANAVCPGDTPTPFHVGQAISSGQARISRTKGREIVLTRLGRWADAQEVTYPIRRLAPDEASYVARLVRQWPAYQKLTLDFLLRPATMTCASIPVPSFLQDGENSLGDGNTTAAREGTGMTVWFMRWLQCLRRIHPSFRAEVTTVAGTLGTPTNDPRDNVLRTRERAHALNHGGGID